ncbi:energy-coupling factor transporter transmembrane component T [Paraoerskovia marina]|uniref:energy-coupling factor transporter transmembrane component T n=1 Tax=Paraoerskovia marina TaxID=545619 RepID=UPI0006938F78|nr:energy-coupling factor transporter transmembrane component T [Paraoerskovia marina]
MSAATVQAPVVAEHAVVAAPARASAPRRAFLRTANPLVSLAGPFPLMVVVFFVADLRVLAAMGVATAILVVAGTLPGPRVSAAVLLGAPLTAGIVAVSFGFWVDAAAVASTPVLVQAGPWAYHAGQLEIGLLTGLRVVDLMLLALLGALATTGPDVVRASIQHLRIPYRLGYAALAAVRFVPRFGHELEVIRSAHRVRGVARGRGPVAATRRQAGYAVPLLAGGIRHAERVSYAMDARAFGAHSTRTERTTHPWRLRDTALVLSFWAACVAALVLAAGV